jgi:hypothetical protein
VGGIKLKDENICLFIFTCLTVFNLKLVEIYSIHTSLTLSTFYLHVEFCTYEYLTVPPLSLVDCR